MSKKKSETQKAALAAARAAGYDGAAFVAQSKDGSNIYICTSNVPTYDGLPSFVKAKDGKAHTVDFKGAEFDECFAALADCDDD